MSTSLLTGLSILTGASVMLVAAPAKAVDVPSMVVIDFTELGYDGTGFDPEPAAGQLDSDDWSVILEPGVTEMDFGGSAGGAGSDFARGLGTGGTDVDGVWAFDVGGGVIGLGIAPNDDIFTPGSFRLALVNTSGADAADLQVEYTVWINNDQVGANSFNLAHSADNETYTPVGDPLVSAADEDALGFVANEVTVQVTPDAAIAADGTYYLAWEGAEMEDAPDRDEFALEGITIRILNVCGNGIMEKKEECDDGLDNLNEGACTTLCTAAACGDGFTQDGEECDDANVEDGDGCSATCTTEGAATDTDTDTDSGTDTDDPTVTGTDTDATMTGATATMTGATSPTTSPTGGSDSDTDSGGEDDEESGCSCRSSGGSAPIFSMLGLMVLGLVRRRR